MSKCDPMSLPCKGSFAQVRTLNIEQLSVGHRQVVLRHPECSCNTGCRRVTLWHPVPPEIGLLDDWVVKVIARVRWGDGCAGPEVEVDWKHGVILDLSGCYDEVSLEIVEIEGSPPDEDNPFVFGALSACCGAGGARGVATRTTARQTATAGGGFAVVDVPPFAYAVAFATEEPDAFFVATTDIIQFGSGAPSAISSTTGDEIPDQFLIVGGANRIAVVNNAVAGDLDFEVVFLIGV